jgi:hypothetical protein
MALEQKIEGTKITLGLFDLITLWSKLCPGQNRAELHLTLGVDIRGCLTYTV